MIQNIMEFLVFSYQRFLGFVVKRLYNILVSMIC